MARLTIDRVTKSFGAFRALDDVSLEVADGEFMAILGASGCGKTTLLRQIAGFDKLDAGRILIGDTVVSAPNVTCRRSGAGSASCSSRMRCGRT